MKIKELDALQSKYDKWKKLINLSDKELNLFLDSEIGKEAGISRQTAKDLNISRGRDSARAILRMRQKNFSDWSALDIEWMNKQISFVSRMLGNNGDFIKDGIPSRKLTSLWIWGHSPNNLKPSDYVS